jgi:uncharacterized protein YndB with AHSA1/START domain/DNA-binding transcriptional ArsR family regulator
MADMEGDVFRALGDENRRVLLDALFEEDGQTLGELVSRLDMTRFGVMKHLRVLEAAGLITTARVGREKLHYLNPVPIQQIGDRWISKFSAPWVGMMAGLKRRLEEEEMETKPSHRFEIYIQAPPEKIWQALIDPEFTSKYYYGTSIDIRDLREGAAYDYWFPDGRKAAEGMLVVVDPPRRLTMTFHALWEPALVAEEASTVTWEIEPQGSICRLSATFESPYADSQMFKQAIGGMPLIMSAMKTLLETGQPLPMAMG